MRRAYSSAMLSTPLFHTDEWPSSVSTARMHSSRIKTYISFASVYGFRSGCGCSSLEFFKHVYGTLSTSVRALRVTYPIWLPGLRSWWRVSVKRAILTFTAVENIKIVNKLFFVSSHFGTHSTQVTEPSTEHIFRTPMVGKFNSAPRRALNAKDENKLEKTVNNGKQFLQWQMWATATAALAATVNMHKQFENRRKKKYFMAKRKQYFFSFTLTVAHAHTPLISNDERKNSYKKRRHINSRQNEQWLLRKHQPLVFVFLFSFFLSRFNFCVCLYE